jgi:hypothetical protein
MVHGRLHVSLTRLCRALIMACMKTYVFAVFCCVSRGCVVCARQKWWQWYWALTVMMMHVAALCLQGASKPKLGNEPTWADAVALHCQHWSIEHTTNMPWMLVSFAAQFFVGGSYVCRSLLRL